LSEIIVVDNGCHLNEEARRELGQIEPGAHVSIVGNDRESYASGANRGVWASRGALVIISNNDVAWIDESSIRPLIQAFDDPRAVIVGPQLRFPDGQWQRSYGAVPSVARSIASVFFFDSLARAVLARWRARNRGCLRVRGYIDGAFMMVRRQCFLELGALDERFEFYGEDAEFCDRARRAGWHLLFVPEAEVIHVRGATANRMQDVARARKLLDAEAKVVQMRAGTYAASIYQLLMAISYWERMLVYGMLSKVLPGSGWSARFATARARYLAARGR